MAQCATAGCGLPTSGKSKYCATHKVAAREAWLARVKDSASAAKERDAKWAALWREATEAGEAAAAACTPEPMIVVERANVLDDSSPIVKQYAPVMGGVCGFAWISVRPGNCSFARWLSKTGRGHKGYYGGWEVSVSGYGQSYEKKLAHAQAAAKVLAAAGIKAYGTGRLD